MEPREQVKKIYCFCYESKIIIIKNKKIVEEIPYSEEHFWEILHDLWEKKRHHYPSSDMIVKAALELYTGARLYRLYRGKVLSDDDLYNSLKELANQEYSAYFSKAQNERREELKQKHECEQLERILQPPRVRRYKPKSPFTRR